MRNAARCVTAARKTQPGAHEGVYDTAAARARRAAAPIRDASPHARARRSSTACAVHCRRPALTAPPWAARRWTAAPPAREMPRQRRVRAAMRSMRAREAFPRDAALRSAARGGTYGEDQGRAARNLGRRAARAVAEVAGNLRGAAQRGGTCQKRLRPLWQREKRRCVTTRPRPLRIVCTCSRGGA